MYFFWLKHYFLFALLTSVVLLVALFLTPLPMGLILFVNAFGLGGLVGLYLTYRFFTRRNFWILYYDLKIPRALLFIGSVVLFELIFIGIILGMDQLGYF